MKLFFDNQYTLIQKNFGHLMNPQDANLIIRLDKGAITNSHREAEARNFLLERAEIREVKNFPDLLLLLKGLKSVSDISAYIGAFRMIDSVFCGLCSILGIKTSLYQHGMENSVQTYKVARIRDKWFKVIFYSIFLFRYCRFIGYNSSRQIFLYMLYLKNNGKVSNSFQNLENNQPDIAFVYSQYYINFWREKWIMLNTEYRLVKFQDIDREISAEYCDKYVYVLQTFYEDGRSELSEYITHILRLPVEEVAILIHPRTSDRVIRKLSSKGYEILKELCQCKGYLGSSSSLLVGLAARGYDVFHIPFEFAIPSFVIECLEVENSEKWEMLLKRFNNRRSEEMSGISNTNFALI